MTSKNPQNGFGFPLGHRILYRDATFVILSFLGSDDFAPLYLTSRSTRELIANHLQRLHTLVCEYSTMNYEEVDDRLKGRNEFHHLNKILIRRHCRSLQRIKVPSYVKYDHAEASQFFSYIVKKNENSLRSLQFTSYDDPCDSLLLDSLLKCPKLDTLRVSSDIEMLEMMTKYSADKVHRENITSLDLKFSGLTDEKYKSDRVKAENALLGYDWPSVQKLKLSLQSAPNVCKLVNFAITLQHLELRLDTYQDACIPDAFRAMSQLVKLRFLSFSLPMLLIAIKTGEEFEHLVHSVQDIRLELKELETLYISSPMKNVKCRLLKKELEWPDLWPKYSNFPALRKFRMQYSNLASMATSAMSSPELTYLSDVHHYLSVGSNYTDDMTSQELNAVLTFLDSRRCLKLKTFRIDDHKVDDARILTGLAHYKNLSTLSLSIDPEAVDSISVRQCLASLPNLVEAKFSISEERHRKKRGRKSNTLNEEVKENKIIGPVPKIDFVVLRKLEYLSLQSGSGATFHKLSTPCLKILRLSDSFTLQEGQGQNQDEMLKFLESCKASLQELHIWVESKGISQVVWKMYDKNGRQPLATLKRLEIIGDIKLSPPILRNLLIPYSCLEHFEVSLGKRSRDFVTPLLCEFKLENLKEYSLQNYSDDMDKRSPLPLTRDCNMIRCYQACPRLGTCFNRYYCGPLNQDESDAICSVLSACCHPEKRPEIDLLVHDDHKRVNLFSCFPKGSGIAATIVIKE